MCVCCRLVSDKYCFVTGRGERYGVSDPRLWFKFVFKSSVMEFKLVGCQYISGLFGDRDV